MTTPVTGQEGAAQDISGAVTSVIVRFVRARVGDYGLAQALNQAGETRPVQVLEDPRSWSTHDEAIRLLAAASQVTGDPEIGRHVGEEMLRQHDGTDVADLLRSLGSPGELLRNVTAAAAKFTTVSTLEPLEVGEAHAVVRAVTRPGFVRHIYMCEFSKGLLSQVPVLFGLVPAVVTETECQARGGRFCLYSVAWEAGQWGTFVDDRSSLFSAAWGEQGVTETAPGLDVDAEAHVALLQEQVRQMSHRLEEVFTTASDLLAVDDISELLARITRRAAQSVNAPKYLLVASTEVGSRAELHQSGFAEDEARELAAELWQPDPDDAGGSRLIVDIASPRQRYGRLAAVYPPGMRFMDREREILALYGNYAAAALDQFTALAAARRARDTAQALFEFSRALSRINSEPEVAKTLADTVPAVIGCDRATVMLWDPEERRLNVRALSGEPLMLDHVPDLPTNEHIRFVAEEEIDLPEEAAATPPPFSSISPDDTPILEQLMSSREIMFADRNTPDPYLHAAFEGYGTYVAVMAPLFSDDEFVGVVAADYLEQPVFDPREDLELRERLSALADQAVTSFQNAWLLEQVGHQAWHDALTGLPNRRLLEDRVAQELERAKRVDENSTIFFVDLDRFKRVNDTLGHAVGDELLTVVAQRLRDTVRKQDTVARFGGDEFAILLPGLSEVEDITRLAERMVEILHEPYQLERAEVLTSASLGIAVSPQDGETYEELLEHADEAMYTAKQLGRNNYKSYGEVSAEEVARYAEEMARLALETALTGAVERNEFFLEYQPYVKLATNRIVGVEALLRWRHPDQGELRPGAFLEVAEQSGLVGQIDEFVINECCRQMREWLDDGLPPLRFSVNISGTDLLDPRFVETVIDALRENSIPSGLCEIELGPAVFANIEEAALRTTVESLQAIGVRFSIDELGQEASTIDQIGQLQVVSLKLDRSLLQGTESGALGELAASLIDMANERGLDSVAKGIETELQLQLLSERGCTAGQGDLLSPPLAPADVLPTVLEWPKGSKGSKSKGGPRGRLDTTEPEPAEEPGGPSDAVLAPEPEPVAEPAPAAIDDDEPFVLDHQEDGEAPSDDPEDVDVDPFEISPDVLSELGLDLPDDPAGADASAPELADGHADESGASEADRVVDDEPPAPAPRTRKRPGRTRTVPPSGPAF